MELRTWCQTSGTSAEANRSDVGAEGDRLHHSEREVILDGVNQSARVLKNVTNVAGLDGEGVVLGLVAKLTQVVEGVDVSDDIQVIERGEGVSPGAAVMCGALPQSVPACAHVGSDRLADRVVADRERTDRVIGADLPRTGDVTPRDLEFLR